MSDNEQKSPNEEEKVTENGSTSNKEKRVDKDKIKSEKQEANISAESTKSDDDNVAGETTEQALEKKEKKAVTKENGDGEENGSKEDAIAKAKAKALAAKKAKAAAAKGTEGDGVKKRPARKKAEPVEEGPSPNQPILDKYVKVIKENLGDDILEDSYINRMSKHVPTLVAKPTTYRKLAEFLRYNEQLAFDYLSEIHGSDFETHMEVYAHLFSFQNKQSVALKVKIDRDHPEIDTVTPIWEGANWPEREAYDLLGIVFKGHPKLERILMPDDWVGHPLRKDYEPYDVEV